MSANAAAFAELQIDSDTRRAGRSGFFYDQPFDAIVGAEIGAYLASDALEMVDNRVGEPPGSGLIDQNHGVGIVNARPSNVFLFHSSPLRIQL